MIEIFAVEKNPNAILTIKNLQKSQATSSATDVFSEAVARLWASLVVIQSDMRTLETTAEYSKFGLKASVHILVSELLGSFGDNELSPECLDGIQHVLHSQGVSIPQNYVSYVAPISAPKVWDEVKSNYNLFSVSE